MSIVSSLLTAAEFAQLPDLVHPQELVRGVIEDMPVHRFRHGKTCAGTAHLLTSFVDEHDLGRVLTNDSSVVTEQGPDTVRGPDVVFVSYAKVPREMEPEYLLVAPDA